jgi:hypothetical protein
LPRQRPPAAARWRARRRRRRRQPLRWLSRATRRLAANGSVCARAPIRVRPAWALLSLSGANVGLARWVAREEERERERGREGGRLKPRQRFCFDAPPPRRGRCLASPCTMRAILPQNAKRAALAAPGRRERLCLWPRSSSRGQREGGEKKQECVPIVVNR